MVGNPAYERLSDKEDEVGRVDGDEFGQRSHQRFVVLHPELQLSSYQTIGNFFQCHSHRLHAQEKQLGNV